ncbi:hypothetical protein [Salinisphaera orenii]|uniref:hypothetical protein n=1 Tax=Salinisphaera orenii TaxID=856731 RepID=UPI0013A61D8B
MFEVSLFRGYLLSEIHDNRALVHLNPIPEAGNDTFLADELDRIARSHPPGPADPTYPPNLLDDLP